MSFEPEHGSVGFSKMKTIEADKVETNHEVKEVVETEESDSRSPWCFWWRHLTQK